MAVMDKPRNPNCAVYFHRVDGFQADKNLVEAYIPQARAEIRGAAERLAERGNRLGENH